MDLIGGVLGLVVMAAVLIGVPIMRERIRISRLRREWYARGRGYAQGKYSVARHPSYYADPAAPDRATGVDPAAPMFADPPTPGSMFKVAAGVLLVCMVCGGAWMAYDVGAHRDSAAQSGSVAVAGQLDAWNIHDNPACAQTGALRRKGRRVPAALQKQCDAYISAKLTEAHKAIIKAAHP